MCFGTGVTRFCFPCSKSNLQNCHYVVGSFSAAYATLLYWSIYDLTSEKSNNSIHFNIKPELSALLISASIISLIVSSVLLYGIKRKIKLILVLWNLIAVLNIVFWTIVFMDDTILDVTNCFSALFLLFIWVYFIYASLIVISGIEEIENESSKNVTETSKCAI